MAGGHQVVIDVTGRQSLVAGGGPDVTAGADFRLHAQVTEVGEAVFRLFRGRQLFAPLRGDGVLGQPRLRAAGRAMTGLTADAIAAHGDDLFRGVVVGELRHRV